MYNDRVVPVRDLGEARSLLGDIDSQILRSFGTGADERALTAAARKDEAGIDALIETYEASYLVDAEKRGLADFHTEWDGYAEVYKRVARFGAKHKDAQASSLYLAEAAPRYAKVDAALANLVKVNDQMASGLNGDIAATYRSSRTITIVLLLAALALGAALAWRVSSEEMIAHQRQMAATAGQIAGGDLTVTVTPKSAEDGLGNAFAEMVANLRELVGEVAQSAGALSSTSQQMAATSEETGNAVGEIASAVSDVAQGAERQVRMVESTRHAIQEAAKAADESAETAQTTTDAADEARHVGDGVVAAAQATEAMRGVADSSREVASAIEELSERSRQIGGIVQTITAGGRRRRRQRQADRGGRRHRRPYPGRLRGDRRRGRGHDRARAGDRHGRRPHQRPDAPGRARRGRGRRGCGAVLGLGRAGLRLDAADLRHHAGDRRLRGRARAHRRPARRAGPAVPGHVLSGVSLRCGRARAWRSTSAPGR